MSDFNQTVVIRLTTDKEPIIYHGVFWYLVESLRMFIVRSSDHCVTYYPFHSVVQFTVYRDGEEAAYVESVQ